MSDLTERLTNACVDDLLIEARERIATLEDELDRRDRQDKFNRGVKDGWPHD